MESALVVLAPAVLMTSGYTNNAIESAPDIREKVELLEKPYATADLLTRVRRTLDRRERGHA